MVQCWLSVGIPHPTKKSQNPQIKIPKFQKKIPNPKIKISKLQKIPNFGDKNLNLATKSRIRRLKSRKPEIKIPKLKKNLEFQDKNFKITKNPEFLGLKSLFTGIRIPNSGDENLNQAKKIPNPKSNPDPPDFVILRHGILKSQFSRTDSRTTPISFFSGVHCLKKIFRCTL